MTQQEGAMIREQRTWARTLALNGVLASFLGGLAYSILLISVDWQAFRVADFYDLQNYANRYQLLTSAAQVASAGDGIIGLISSELGWTLLIEYLGLRGIEPEVFLTCCTAISSLIAAYTIVRCAGVASVVLLVNPVSVDLYVSQVRSATAFSLVLSGFVLLLPTFLSGFGHECVESPSKRQITLKRWAVHFLGVLLLCMGALLHTMMALFILWGLAVVLLDFASNRYRSTFIEKSFVWVSICGALAMVAVFIAIVPALLDSVGDRRDISAQETKGLMYLLSWIALLSYCYIRGYLRGTQNSWFWSVAGMMLFALLSEILGAAAFRYVAVILPLFLAALLHVESKKMALYIVLCCFNAMLFVPWVDWGI